MLHACVQRFGVTDTVENFLRTKQGLNFDILNYEKYYIFNVSILIYYNLYYISELYYNDCKVPEGTFRYFSLKFFLVVDLWKIKLN